MARIVDGPEITGQVTHKQTGQSYGPVTVTVSPKVYTDREMTVSVTSLTTDGTGVFSCYAPPGTYTFTTAAVDAATIESVEVLGHEAGTGTPQSAAYVASNPAQAGPLALPFVLAPAPSGGDDTAALAAVHATAKAANVPLQLQPGHYKATVSPFDGSIPVYGMGYGVIRGNLGVFGTAANLTASNYSGTVLECTAASGTFTHIVGAGFIRATLKDLVILGPGSGTATGLVVDSVLDSDIDVLIVNFATGASLINVEDSDLGLKLWGCTNPLAMTTATNNNRFRLNVQKCTATVTMDTSCNGNTFDTLILQANTGQSMVVKGGGHLLINPWVENAGGTTPSIQFTNASYCEIIGGTYNTAHDQITIDNTCTGISLSDVGATINDNGVGTRYSTGRHQLGTQRTVDLTGNPINLGGGWTPGYNSLWGWVNTDIGGALNDLADWGIDLPPGTYRFEIFGGTSTDAPIITVSVDGVSAGTWDQYAASAAAGFASLTGIVLSGFGGLNSDNDYVRRVRFQSTSKNASSSGYIARLGKLVITRTA